MATDYIPKSLPNLQTWLTGVKAGITADGATCGQSAAQITTDTTLVDNVLTSVTTAITKETQALDAQGTARGLLNQKRQDLRNMINRYKSASGWTEGMADAWDVNTHASSIDINTQKPHIGIRNFPGFVIITGRKPGFSSVTIQMRIDGSANWNDIGIKINHFPFHDSTAPQTAGKPEKREYRAIGYDGDQQVGQPSDIVTAVFSG